MVWHDEGGAVRIEEVIGHNIRARREERRLSQEELGRQVGKLLRGDDWPRQAVSAAEKGGRGFSAAELVVFAFVLNVSMERLFRLPPGETSIHLPQGVGIDREALRPSTEDGQSIDHALGEALKTLNSLVAAHRESQKWQRYEAEAVIKLDKQLQDIVDRPSSTAGNQS